MQVFPLSEGVFTIGFDKIFIPFDLAVDKLEQRSRGSLLVEVQPFLVITNDDVILLDTGLGFRLPNGSLQIHENIKALGYQPEQVTKVLLSHLHKDHAGGVVTTDAGVTKTTFPNAVYYVYRPEANYALANGAPSYEPADLEVLFASDQVVWLDGQEGRINETISFRHSGGHCPYHIVFLLEEGHDTLFFGGDEAPQHKQMKTKYIAKYDYDGKRALMLREQWADEGKKSNWKFLYYHDIQTPMEQF